MEAPRCVCTAFLEAPPFVCNSRSQEARPPKRRMQQMVTFNIKNTITWNPSRVYAPPFWRLRLLHATHGHKRRDLQKGVCNSW